MYRIFLSVLLFLLSMPVFAERTFKTVTPYYAPYNTSQAYYGGDYIPQRRYTKNRSAFSDINDLERYALNRNFSRDSDRIRVERLETLAFGAVQEGDIYTRYDNVREAILSRPKQNYKTSLLRSISDFFNGQLTGFTPQINNNSDIYSYPSNAYPSDFGISSYSDYDSPFRRGYKMNNYATGTGSSIKILD